MNTVNEKISSSSRSSNLELYRIIVMLLIVAHHSIVNSGVMELMAADPLSLKSTFAYLFGMWGKTGINCFVMITGYFMCTSHITGRKFAKLVLEVLFYNIVISSIFWVCGYAPITLKGVMSVLMPVKNMTTGFTSAFIVFFLTIPFLNKLVQNLSQKQHLLLVLLSLGIYVLPQYLPLVKIQMNYVAWFGVIYFIASYLRLHADSVYKSDSASFWGWMSIASISLSMLMSVALVHYKHDPWAWQFILHDCNGIMAVVVSVCTFMWFKNLRIRQTQTINTIAASCFGVLLIHANSDMMRHWLWRDIANMCGLYEIGGGFALEMIVVVLLIYIVCTLMDYIRIQCIEKPIFKFLDNKLTNYSWWSNK